MNIGKRTVTAASALFIALSLSVSLPAQAADPADEMSLMLVRDSFFAAHAVPLSGVYGSSEDTALVVQAGNQNLGRAEQLNTAQGNIAIAQQGDMNAAGLFQADGVGNVVAALQQGQFNYLSSTQSGSYNNANLAQSGDANRLQLDQLDGNNTANVTQNGYSRLTLEQGGGSTANISLAPGDPLAPFTLTVIQPPGDTLTITQP